MPKKKIKNYTLQNTISHIDTNCQVSIYRYRLQLREILKKRKNHVFYCKTYLTISISLSRDTSVSDVRNVLYL